MMAIVMKSIRTLIIPKNDSDINYTDAMVRYGNNVFKLLVEYKSDILT
jgi:hypothetical protein